jgi:hypothetical protein
MKGLHFPGQHRLISAITGARPPLSNGIPADMHGHLTMENAWRVELRLD